MTTDPINAYLAAAKEAALQTASGAQVLTAAVHHRWSVKTGADPDAANLVGQAPTDTTIASLRSLAVPAVLPPDGRAQGAEETVWRLAATLTGYKRESDGDYHLVIADEQGNTMIAEIPDPAQLASGSVFAQQIAAARQAFDNQFDIRPAPAPAVGAVAPALTAGAVAPALTAVKESVTLEGVGFFDFNHGQDGVAPNAIELHPVLSIQFSGPSAAAPAQA
jgi:hypothetical protein